ncbi:fatty acid hydroxylase [Fictibacillus macauensis ZFHKF-1]|uniref:Fatty acid hydroxylase n=1 Tax=Fictibacillus macauensis ZFHKF-1 TaxID=1196324 RepID=I8AIV2_9BACL|nr:sterol desaturase family protein [Fictibacillus macauensis]EIT85687.1 fatty acid hydroxylase [Fictibacillus macauensis ZFHKF-1]
MKSKGLYLDYFLHFDIVVMGILMVGCMISAAVIDPIWTHLLYFGIGIVVFMFSEYGIHRFLFHLKTPKNQWFLKFLKRLHYDHHKTPNDLKLLFLPIWYSIPNLSILAIIFYAIVRNVPASLAFGSGLIAMLLVYEWKHYIAHRPIKPRTKFGMWLKKTHTLHHFKNENYWYGVSTPFVDALFGTLKNEKEVETSATARDLEKRGIVTEEKQFKM